MWKIENPAGVENNLVDRIVRAAGPVSGTTLIILGLPDNADQYSGACIPRPITGLAGFPSVVARLDSDWDCIVCLSPKTCRYAGTHPAFFAQLLAHELSHAQVAITDFDLHIYCAFLDISIFGASNGQITKWHQLPHERAHDQVGVAVAGAIFDRSQLNAELLALSESRNDAERLLEITTMNPRADVRNLREEVRRFCLPFAGPLIAAWEQRLEDVEDGIPSIVALAPHIRAFLE